MNRSLLKSALAAAALCVLAAGPALAETNDAGTVRIENVWARATAPGAQAGAAYMSLSAIGDKGDRLIAGDVETIAAAAVGIARGNARGRNLVPER